MSNDFSPDDFAAARKRLAPYVRKTPMMDLKLDTGLDIKIKLENLQLSGSFKIRGALNTVLSLDETSLKKGLVTASGGNHGMGVAIAGALTGAPATIYLPKNTPTSKIEKLRSISSSVIVDGDVWDDANALALKAAEENGMTYVHPFADRSVIIGQGTLALEILEAAPMLDTLMVAIGGGGLISGVATAAKLLNPDIKIIGIEAIGAPTLFESCKAGELVTLEQITTRAGTLAPRQSAKLNLDIISEKVTEIILVEDDEMESAARWLWQSCGLATELSAAAAIAALRTSKYKPAPEEQVGVIICGAGYDGFN